MHSRNENMFYVIDITMKFEMSKYVHTQAHCLAVDYEPEGKEKRMCAFHSHMYCFVLYNRICVHFSYRTQMTAELSYTVKLAIQEKHRAKFKPIKFNSSKNNKTTTRL